LLKTDRHTVHYTVRAYTENTYTKFTSKFIIQYIIQILADLLPSKVDAESSDVEFRWTDHVSEINTMMSFYCD